MSEEEQINIYDNSRLFQDKTYAIVIISYGGAAILVWLVRQLIFIVQNIALMFIPENTNEIVSGVKSNLMLFREMWKIFIPYILFIGIAYIFSGLILLKWKKLARALLVIPSVANLTWYVLLMIHFHNNILHNLTFTETLSPFVLYLIFTGIVLFIGFWIGLMPIINFQYISRSILLNRKK